MEYTLTYDEKVKGWTSFHSYVPERMANMNSEFYSFKDGQLHIHNQTDLEFRNSFYGQSPASTEIELVINEAPSEVKLFKTLKLEGSTRQWDATINTDLAQGHIKKESFVTKEGMHEAYFRRNETDELNSEYISIQGVGSVASVASNVITYSYTVPSSVYVGDKLFSRSGSSNILLGVITKIEGLKITVDTLLSTPSAGDFCFSAKNPVVESNGIKGYYANIRLTNNSTGAVELFAVNSDIVKSFT